MKFEINNILSLLTFLAGAGSAVWGMVKWYGDAQKKAYAAERAFWHLNNNQEQMRQTIALLQKELDELSADFKTQTACVNLLIVQSGQTISGLFGHKTRTENDAE